MDKTVIIPAYNEERTVANVLKVVKEVDVLDRIIVVSDGSTDNTAKIAESMGVDVIILEKNIGKGGALKAGLDSCTSDVVLFLDADLIGLSKEHVLQLLKPVIAGDADMTIGVFSSGRFATDLAQRIAPNLSGQRAIRKELLDKIPNMDITRYGVEVALTRYMKMLNYRVQPVVLKDMTHCMKEEKLGVIKGFIARLRMYWDILKCLKLQKVK